MHGVPYKSESKYSKKNQIISKAAQNSNQWQSNVLVITGGEYGKRSMEAKGFRQRRLIEEGEGD